MERWSGASRLAAVLTTLEAQEAGAAVLVSVWDCMRRCDVVDYLHAAADVAGTTTTQLHHVLLGVLEQSESVWRIHKRGKGTYGLLSDDALGGGSVGAGGLLVLDRGSGAVPGGSGLLL